MSTVVLKNDGQVIRTVDNVPLTFCAGPDKQGEKCQVCSHKIADTFYDMKTKPGLFNQAWGILCPNCALRGVGVGVCGLGYGQRYKRLADSRWIMTTGGK